MEEALKISDSECLLESENPIIRKLSKALLIRDRQLKVARGMLEHILETQRLLTDGIPTTHEDLMKLIHYHEDCVLSCDCVNALNEIKSLEGDAGGN